MLLAVLFAHIVEELKVQQESTFAYENHSQCAPMDTGSREWDH